MSHRSVASAIALVAILMPAAAVAQDAGVPRTAWGAPDLQGVWDSVR